MKATEANFLEFLKKSPQFVIAIYQRTYSWTERECHQLWEDILRTGRDDAIPAHLIVPVDPAAAPKFMRYVPAWASPSPRAGT